MAGLSCPLCGIHQSKDLSNLMRHISLFHADEPNFHIDCTLQGCRRTFKNYHTYRNHIYAFHGTSTGELYLQPDETVLVPSTDSDTDCSLNGNNQEVLPIQRSAALWTLKVRDGYCLPQSTTECIIKDVDSLYKVYT